MPKTKDEDNIPIIGILILCVSFMDLIIVLWLIPCMPYVIPYDTTIINNNTYLGYMESYLSPMMLQPDYELIQLDELIYPLPLTMINQIYLFPLTMINELLFSFISIICYLWNYTVVPSMVIFFLPIRLTFMLFFSDFGYILWPSVRLFHDIKGTNATF